MMHPRSRRRPLCVVSSHRWLRVFRVEPPSNTLSLRERLYLANVLAQRFQEPCAYTEDPLYAEASIPWRPSFRPAPFHTWRASGATWELSWPDFSDDDAWALWEPEELYGEPPEPDPPRIQVFADHVRLSVWGTGLCIFADQIRLLSGDSLAHDEDWEEVDDHDILRAAAGLTDWVVVDGKHNRMVEPVRCADCGHRYELSVQQLDCERCGSERIWVERPSVAAERPQDEAARLVGLLVSLGWLEVGSLVEVVACVEGVLRREGVGGVEAALLKSPAVAEVYGTEASWEVLLGMW